MNACSNRSGYPNQPRVITDMNNAAPEFLEAKPGYYLPLAIVFAIGALTPFSKTACTSFASV